MQDVDLLSHDAPGPQLATPPGGGGRGQADHTDRGQRESGGQQQVQAARTRLEGSSLLNYTIF